MTVAPSGRDDALRQARAAYEAATESHLQAILRERLRLREDHDENRNLQKAEYEWCRRDIVRFCNRWLWTFDQRRAADDLPAAVPFILRPKQEELFPFVQGCLNDRTHGLIEKSRDEGATYLMLLFGLHAWLYTPGFKMGVGSRKSTLVDLPHDMDAILPKFRYMLYSLPDWFWPEGYRAEHHDNVNRIYNPQHDGLIRGEGGAEIGRGGRSTLYLVDEAAFLPGAETADRALSQNTNTVIWLSTPNGIGNLFYRKRHGGRVRVFTLHWRDNPAKNYTARVVDERGKAAIVYPWYEHQKSVHAPVTVAQEIDIDYAASLEGSFIRSLWLQAAVNLHRQPGYEEMQDAGGVTAALDVGEGSAENVLGLRRGVVLVSARGWLDDNTLATAHEAIRFCRQHDVEGFRFDAVGVGSSVSGAHKSLYPPPVYAWEGYNGGTGASHIKYDDDPRRRAKDRFANRKAEDQWALRRRFEKTYQMVHGEAVYPLHELISIPDLPTLIAQLPVTRYFTTEAGIIRSESKKELSHRGVASPDWYEMLYMLFSARPITRNIPFIPQVV